jgi:hypothetical protein
MRPLRASPFDLMVTFDFFFFLPSPASSSSSVTSMLPAAWLNAWSHLRARYPTTERARASARKHVQRLVRVCAHASGRKGHMRDPGQQNVNARLANTTGSVAHEHATPAKNTQGCLSERLAAKCSMIVRAAQAHHANSVPLSPMPLVSNLSFGRSASARPCSRAPRPLPSVHPCFSITLRARSIPFGSPMSTRQLFDGHVAVGRWPTGGVAVCLRMPLHVCCHSDQQRTWSMCVVCTV